MTFPYSHVYLILFLAAAVTSLSPTKNASDCSCGFLDHATHNLFTDSAIVYFNETFTIPAEIFETQHYENNHEKGWNTLYRQGADASNVRVGRDLHDGASNTSLELFVDPHTPNHLVVGGGVQTARKDIFYGSFRMMMRSPTALGSSLSMTLNWNDSQGISTNLQSTNGYSTAWVSTLSGDEFPDRSLGVNYTVLSNSSNNVSPWDYTEYRVDWTAKQVNWTIGGKLFRQLNKTDERFPQTPVPLILKHWSVGNYFTMQGPPANRSVANVGWVRLFFNSSLATDQDRHDFDLRCQLKDACDMDDTKLRGASSYAPEATLKWKQIQKPRGNKTVPILLLIICGTISSLLITNALVRRLPWKKWKPGLKEKDIQPEYSQSVGLTSAEANFAITPPASYFRTGTFTMPSTPRPISAGLSSEVTSIYLMAITQEEDVASEKRKSARMHWRDYNAGLRDAEYIRSTNGSVNGDADGKEGTAGFVTAEALSGEERRDTLGYCHCAGEVFSPEPEVKAASDVASPEPSFNVISSTSTHTAPSNLPNLVAPFNSANYTTPPNLPNLPNHKPDSNLPATKHRIDYLAGLVALSCLLVTAIEFCLTFSPGAINPEANVHYESEIWARKTVDSYFLNLIWFGPFLMTSTRFLVSNYLKDGDLLHVAHKVVGRPFRLLGPILAIAMLEYFFMDAGATAWLEYLPSVTWSTWPFTTVPDNFGHFISEILELAYLIPNAAPQITFNYCTGILWTIPVQLQGTWTTLLAVIVIREIKKPWKRLGFYCFCILMHWYALSWGTYFYLAILLADLDLKYRRLHIFYYPVVMLCVVLAFGGLSLDMVTQWTRVNYAAYEYGIHPDAATGLPIMFTDNAGYPQYYVPKANGVVFALGLQALVELSPFAQRLFSFRFLIWLFPHIFTIYLIHGFVFWSIGSTVCVYLSGRVPYLLNVLIVAVCCYAALFASLPILTPVVDTLGKHITANIWHFAHERPAPRRPTLFPFPRDFLFVRQGRLEVTRSVLERWVGRKGKSPAVGWRTGWLSGNVEVLRRNNSSVKLKKRAIDVKEEEN